MNRLLLVIALLLAAMAASFTLESSVRDQGYDREALLNPWLAAGRLLEKQGLRVRFSPHYSTLPPHAQVIMLATPLDMLTADEQKKLLNWVQGGGHLVTELQDVSRANEPSADELILKQLEVRLRKHHEARKADSLSPPAGFEDSRVSGEGVLQTRFNRHYYLQNGKPAYIWAVEDKNGMHAMRFALARGHITVLSDSDWMDNRLLGEGDHGALLWRVINAQKNARENNAEIWLIHGQDRPSLFSLLWESAAAFLLAALLFIMVWLWQASRRFGPVQKILPENRRRLSEHLQASGRYLLQHQALATLFEASRQRLLSQLQRHYPQWKNLPPERLAQHLGERASIESTAIVRLLTTPAPENILQFAADIRLINRLRKAL